MAVAQQRRALTASLPSPIGGWNARDSLAEMNPLDAVEMVNFYPTPTEVTLRKGYSRYSQLTTSTGVQTISSITFSGTTATLTTASAHGLSSGARVSITGTTPSDYSGLYIITVTGATTFTYEMALTPSGNATVVGAYTIGVTNAVNTLMNYSSPSISKLFGSDTTNIYDVSTATATVSLTGNTNGEWVHSRLTNAGGSFMPAVNGVDPMVVYDGTLWQRYATTNTAQTISSITRGGTGNLTATLTTASPHNLVTGNTITVAGAVPSQFNGTYRVTVTGASVLTYLMGSAPSGDASTVGTYTVKYFITGENSNTFATVNLFKNRLYFVIENSLDFCYLSADAINGAVTKFPLGGIFKNGGYLQAMGTWTIDAGYGVDDLAVFITSNGEAAVYKGSDPSDPNDWSLVGIWQLGQTFARKCFFKFGGDLLVLTQDGLVPLSAGLQSTRLDPRVNITDKIFLAISQATSIYADFYGWQINYYAKANMLILNIPVFGGSEQYVMNNLTKSWAKFTDFKANCWELSGEDMYFGGAGFVGKFYDTLADEGANIKAFVQQAYNYFENRGKQKRFTMVRPIFFTDGGLPTVLCTLSTDFETVNSSNQITFNPSLLQDSRWDVATWDEDSWNGGGLLTSKVWQGVTGFGYAGSISLNVASQNIDLRWASTDYVMEAGSVL
jgi:hypothetical protein